MLPCDFDDAESKRQCEMNTTERIISLILAIVVIVSFSGCGNDDAILEGNKRPTRIIFSNATGLDTTKVVYSDDLLTAFTSNDGKPFLLFEYDSLNRFIQATNSEGEQVIRASYSDGRMSEVQFGTGWFATVTTLHYDSNDQVYKTTTGDGIGFTTTYEYDSRGNVIRTQEDDYIARYEYDDAKNPVLNVYPQLGFNVSWPWLGSLHNNPVKIERKFSSRDFEIRSEFEYVLDAHGYPIEIVRNEGDHTSIIFIEYS